MFLIKGVNWSEGNLDVIIESILAIVLIRASHGFEDCQMLK